MARNVFTETLSAPLDGATRATVEISAGDGNLTVDRLSGGAQMLASGSLEYQESQGRPVQACLAGNGRATLTVKGGPRGQRWFHLPWSTCNGATEWSIHLSPAVMLDISARSGGGNVKLDLSGLSVSRVEAHTGGGNMEVVLPDTAAGLGVAADTGAGNVVVQLPAGVAALIHATTGLGKAVVDPRFVKTDKNTYQSPDYESATQRVELTLKSGAGNVVVSTR